MPWPEAWFHDVKHRHRDDALFPATEHFGKSRTGSSLGSDGFLLGDVHQSIDIHWQDVDGFIKANDRWLGDEVRLL